MFSLKMNRRKVFSIVIAGISLLMIIFSFLPYIGSGSYNVSLWSSEAGTLSIGVTQLIVLLCVMTLYLMHLFMNLNEKWFKYANYGVGFVVIYQIIELFQIVTRSGVGTRVGFWFEFLLALGLGTCSVLWYFMSEEPFATKSTPIVGYDPATGKPIYAKIKSYDPKTGKPIYEKD